jgi:hypothetical protein
MKFKIYFTIGDYPEDYFIVEGETIEEIKKIVKYEEDKRGLSSEKNNLRSEEIK